MKFLLFFIIFVFSMGYELGVNNLKDAKKLDDLGFECNKQNTFYVCLGSNDLNELQRIQSFVYLKFKINTMILKDKNNSNLKIVKSVPDKKIKTAASQLKVKNNIPKHGYCIQIEAFKGPVTAKRVYFKYKSYPFARVEKIGNFYVLRVGEGDFKTIKKMNLNGLVRKCDIIPQRIIIDNFNIKELEKK